MTRCVVSVATSEYYRRGQKRLVEAVTHQGYPIHHWHSIPAECPSHQDKPYAFKAYALEQEAEECGTELLIWADACILPIRSMEPLWERIERDGYWMSRNGYSNYEWTADSAYPDLFPGACTPELLNLARADNRLIPHVVATAFGINVKHPKGRAFLDEYYRLASETRAFCGPWCNSAFVGSPNAGPPHTAQCGPPDVRGHRHDQTAASVIAWRLGFELTDPPDIFAYGKADEPHDERTILLADGSYS